MKKISMLLCAGVLACALCAPLDETSAQAAKAPVWDYPVKPGTPQWAAFETHDQMLEAIQIPESILNSLTTEELVEICLNYPLSFDFFAYSSLLEGLVKNVAINFNGVQELFRRSDNVQCLLDVLKNNDLLMLQSKEAVLTTLEIGKLINRHSLVEVLLSHESVIANANAGQQREIAMIAVKNTLVKERTPHLYSRYSLESSAYLLGATLKTADIGAASSPELERFMKEGTTQDVRQLIEELVGNYVKF
jgi:hypothetical protein